MEEPHEPANPDAGTVAPAAFAPVDELPTVELLPVVDAVPDGDVGVVIVFSNPQADASAAARSTFSREKRLVITRVLTVLYRQAQFRYQPFVICVRFSEEIEDTA